MIFFRGNFGFIIYFLTIITQQFWFKIIIFSQEMKLTQRQPWGSESSYARPLTKTAKHVKTGKYAN